MAAKKTQAGKRRGRYDPKKDTSQPYDLVDNPKKQEARRALLEESIFEPAERNRRS